MKKSGLNSIFPDNVSFQPKAQQDFLELDHSQQITVAKAVIKVAHNPAPQSEGGLGKPLGSRRHANLTGFLKIKLKSSGLRVVYKYLPSSRGMDIVIISVRSEDYVYDEAARRLTLM